MSTTVTTSVLSSQTGAAPTFQAAATSNVCECPSVGQKNVMVIFRNTNAATRVITVVFPGNTSYGSANPDPTVTIAATTGENWFPVDPAQLNTSGQAEFQVDNIAGVTVACVKIG